jgi:hypothetical protein
MITTRTPLRSRRRRLKINEWMHLQIGRSGLLPPPFKSDAARRRCWERHRDEMLAQCHGKRPDAWWTYESPIPFPADPAFEEAALFEANLLSDHERERLLRCWRMRFDDAWQPNFVYLASGNVWLHGEAARAAHFEWAGIPPRLVEQWTAEREAAKQPSPAA